MFPHQKIDQDFNGDTNQRLMTMFLGRVFLNGVTWTVKGTSWWQLKQRLVTRLRYCSCIMDRTPVLESFWIEHQKWRHMTRMIGDWQTSWIINTMGWYIRGTDKKITSKRLLHRDATRMRKASGGKVCHNFRFKKRKTCYADDPWSYYIGQFIWLTTQLWLLKETYGGSLPAGGPILCSSCSKAGHPWDRTTALLHPVVLAIL